MLREFPPQKSYSALPKLWVWVMKRELFQNWVSVGRVPHHGMRTEVAHRLLSHSRHASFFLPFPFSFPSLSTLSLPFVPSHLPALSLCFVLITELYTYPFLLFVLFCFSLETRSHCSLGSIWTMGSPGTAF